MENSFVYNLIYFKLFWQMLAVFMMLGYLKISNDASWPISPPHFNVLTPNLVHGLLTQHSITLPKRNLSG